MTQPADSPHKPAEDKEEIYFEGSPKMRGELGKVFVSALIAALLIGAAVALRMMRPNETPWWAYVILVVLAILCFVITLVLIRSTRYRITNYRIDFERGILSKRIDTLELWHVDDVSFKQSLMDRVFNVGDLTVLSDDQTNPRLELNGLPNPRPLFETLKQRVIAVKRQRGVVKMDIGQ